MLEFYTYYEKYFYAYKWERLAACLPVFHQLLHVADFVNDIGRNFADEYIGIIERLTLSLTIGPMHVYAQWGMERLCGMITRTAKSKVKANRNMENTMLLTEAKHCLGYVTNSADFRVYDSDDENRSGMVMLTRVFEKRLISGAPQNSRPAGKSITLNHVSEKNKVLGKLERQRLVEYVRRLSNWTHQMSSDIPNVVQSWKRLIHLTEEGNSNIDFRLTSSIYRDSNNTRSSSMVMYRSWTDNEHETYGYGRVMFLFTVELPAELNVVTHVKTPEEMGEAFSEPIGDDNEDIVHGTKTHRLAYIQDFDIEYDGPLIRQTTNLRHAVIPITSILGLIGLMQKGNSYYICTKYSSLLVAE